MMRERLPTVERLNRMLEGTWRDGLLAEPSLDASALEAKALRKESADRIPGEHWRAPFELLAADLADGAALNPLGRAMAHGQIVGLLRQRIRIGEMLSRHPEIVQRPVTAPLIVIGQMRSGTTRVQRLLACDPRFAACTLEETLRPVPGRWGNIGRRAATLGIERMLRACNPAIGAVHPTAPGAADEEAGLQAIAFHGALFEAEWQVPRFTAYWRSADPLPVYRELKCMLQLLGHRRGDDPRRTRLMKAPQFLGDLDALLSVFPDARLIAVERDASDVAASAASLVWHQRRVQSDRADKAAIAAEWLAKAEERAARAARALARHQRAPLVTLPFDELEGDWRGAMRRTYAALGLDLSAEVERRMTAYVARAHAHRGHRYDPAEFGLRAPPQRGSQEADQNFGMA